MFQRGWLLCISALVFAWPIAAQPAATESASSTARALPWIVEHYEGNPSCSAWDEVSKPENSKKWQAVRAESPAIHVRSMWIRVRSATPIELDQGWIAAVRGERGHFLHHQMGATPTRGVVERYRPGKIMSFGTRYLGVEVPRRLMPDTPWLLCVLAPLEIPTDAFGLHPEEPFRAADMTQMQFTAACFGVMLAMMLSALFFGQRLRDPLYFWYAGHVGAFALFQSRSNWTIFRWTLDWPGTPDLALGVADFAMGLSIFCAARFVCRFLDLAARNPSAERWLKIASNAVLAFSAVLCLGRLIPIPAVLFVRIGQNAFAAITMVLTLVIAVRIAHQGQRYARFFLIGWTPLLLVGLIAAAGAAFVDQSIVYMSGWLLPAAAFEALVLSLGMADRTLMLRQERDAARRDAEIDPLTGVLNRRGMFARLERSENAAAASRGVVLYCDLDYFKRINDGYGHDAGDQCLRHFATVARSVISSEDVLGRIGGEEFVIFMPRANVATAEQVAEKLRAKLQAESVVWNNTTIPLKVSVGISELRAGDSGTQALVRADTALYRAKAEGRDRVRVA